MLLHWLASSKACSLDRFIWLTWRMVNLDTCRSSSWPIRWHYKIAYQGCTRQIRSHLQVIRSVWKALLRLAAMAFNSLRPCQLAFCPVPLASRLGCWISWYPDSLTIGAGLACPAFHKQMVCFWNLPWSVAISYPRQQRIQLYGPFSHRFLNDIQVLLSFFLIHLWYARVFF